MINELIKATRDGDIEARDKILLAHQYIIDLILFRFRYVKMDESTKRYGAILGIIAAIKNFNADKGNFAGYAYQCALRKAQREMNQDYLIRHPNAKVNKCLKDKTTLYGIMTLSEDYDASEFDELMTVDEIPDTIAKEILQDSLNELNELERDAIYQKYDYHNSTLKKTGDKHGVSHECVRLACDRAFAKLKKIFLEKAKHQQKEKYG